MKNKLQFIEGIRGLAALIVIFQHFVLMFYPALYTGNSTEAHITINNLEHIIAITPLNIFYNGNFAVCVFFVLSGFVLSYKYFQTNDVNVLVEYSIKRYFRLLLPVGFSIVFAITMIAIVKPDFVKLESYTRAGNWLKELFSGQATFLDIIYNMFIDVFMNGNNKYNPVLWTMSVEFLGSLMLFVTLLLLHQISKKQIVLTIIVIFLILAKFYFYSAFFIGALICGSYVSVQEAKTKPRLGLHFILFLAGIYFASYPTSWQFLRESIYAPLLFLKMDLINLSVVMGSGILIYLVSKSKSAQTLFSLRFFRFLGQISFSSYLIHLVIMATLSDYMFTNFNSYLSYNTLSLFTLSITLVLVFIISWLVYKLVDKNAIKFSSVVTGKVLFYLKINK